MAFACKIAGHKWNGCTCARCGEYRDEEHDWHFSPLDSSGRCRERCLICGKVRDTEHAWDGCVCSRCGKHRDEGHRLGPVKPLEGFDLGSTQRLHGATCSRCNRIIFSKHHLETLPGCRRRCAECGYESVCHDFHDGVCKECGISEEQYCLDLILSGTVAYCNSIDANKQGEGTYGDRIKSADAIAQVAWHYRSSYSQISGDLIEALSQVGERGEVFSKQSEQTLCDLACDDSAYVDMREAAVAAITDPAMKSKAQAAVDAYLKVHPKKTQADIDFENAMIAADSGLGRTG